jgi:hypothetical protein
MSILTYRRVVADKSLASYCSIRSILTYRRSYRRVVADKDILLQYEGNDLSATNLLYVRIDILLQYEGNDLSATNLLYVRIDILLQFEAND